MRRTPAPGEMLDNLHVPCPLWAKRSRIVFARLILLAIRIQFVLQSVPVPRPSLSGPLVSQTLTFSRFPPPIPYIPLARPPPLARLSPASLRLGLCILPLPSLSRMHICPLKPPGRRPGLERESGPMGISVRASIYHPQPTLPTRPRLTDHIQTRPCRPIRALRRIVSTSLSHLPVSHPARCCQCHARVCTSAGTSLSCGLAGPRRGPCYRARSFFSSGQGAVLWARRAMGCAWAIGRSSPESVLAPWWLCRRYLQPIAAAFAGSARGIWPISGGRRRRRLADRFLQSAFPGKGGRRGVPGSSRQVGQCTVCSCRQNVHHAFSPSPAHLAL